MTRSGLFSSSVQCAVSILLLSLATGCNKKAQILYETEQHRLTLTELQGQSKKLESEILATGNLGRYQSTQPAHIVELKQLIERQKNELVQLKADSEAAKIKAESMQAEVNSYRSSFRNF
ncbi:MAG TPA: hypothetical protein DCP71_02730 [Verrucomicrobiales bacterium]|nr:hypothetical protein [Verrucomicrobiales bacterium]